MTKCTTPKQTGLPADVSSVPEPKTIGYGFDDGPNCTHNIFYDYLASQNQKATMFFIGSNVMNWPLEAQRALADGHQICGREWLRCFKQRCDTVFLMALPRDRLMVAPLQ